MKKRSLERRKPCVGEEEEGFNKVYIFLSGLCFIKKRNKMRNRSRKRMMINE